MAINTESKDKSKAQFVIDNSTITWELGDVRVVFSNPDIQTLESVVMITDISDILYFHYAVTVYRKVYKEKNEKYKIKWKKTFSVDAYDFPALLNVPDMVKKLVRNDFATSAWQKETKTDSHGRTRTWLRKSYNTIDILIDDCYTMSRTVCLMGDEKRIDSCTLYIGLGREKNGSGMYTSYTRGLSLLRLEVKDLISFGDAVSAFIQMSIDLHNQKEQQRLDEEKSTFSCENKNCMQCTTV